MKDVIDYFYQWFTSRGQEFCFSHVEETLPLILSAEIIIFQ